jgi:NitT/TauT family transport system substrate-binding protein
LEVLVRRDLLTALTITALAAASAGCSSSAKASSSGPSGSSGGGSKVTLRLGYFPNVTHAPAIVGVQSGTFAAKLGPNVKLDLKTYNAGSDVVTALLAGDLDASFVGPNPAINGFQKTSKGIRIVAGTASGGASLVVKPSINSAADLKGKKVATPQLGNTQDVSLRTWLKQNGLNTDTSGGGDVHIVPQDNSTTLTAFEQGDIDGAWVPEPWATRLVKEGGGKILVNEASLWPKGEFVTTELIVTTGFLNAHPDVVQNLIAGLDASITLIKTNPSQAQTLVNDGIKAITGKALKPTVIASSFKNLTFTLDPIASSLQTDAQRAKDLGFLKSSDITGIFDLSLLNKVLAGEGKAQISSP